MKKYFTLTELIISVIVIGILVAIVLLNISDLRKDADETAFTANEKEVQKAVDRYYIDYGKYPTDPQPSKNNPQLVIMDEIVPDYIRSEPDGDFWVHDDGKVTGDRSRDSTAMCIMPEIIVDISVEKRTCVEAEAEGYTCISTAEELRDIDNNLDGKYILMNDIDLSGYPNWVPIAHEEEYTEDSTGFTGILDGNGYSIRNLNVEADSHFAGFMSILSGELKNIMFEKGKIINNSEGWFPDELVGAGVIGKNYGNIQNTGVENYEVKSLQYNTGGLVGINEGGTISNVYTIDSSIQGINNVGGLIGNNDNGTISNAYTTGNVMGEDRIGGLIGNSEGGVISKTYSTGDIEGERYLGGLVGENGSEISNSYATDNVEGDGYVGGLIGWNYNTIKNTCASGNIVSTDHYAGGLIGYNFDDGVIDNSFATGNVKSTKDYVGGLIGMTEEIVTNSYATGNVEGDDEVGGLIGMDNSTKTENNYATGTVKGEVSVGGLIGSSRDGIISNSYATGDVIGGYYSVGGLIGGNSGHLVNSYATGDVIGERYSVGGLIGDNSGHLVNSYATGNVTGGEESIGGLIGINSGIITNSYATGNVTGGEESIGGLIGTNLGPITNSYAAGDVKGYNSNSVGGLVGYNDADINNAYALGNVEGKDYVGGLIGEHDEGELIKSYAIGSVEGDNYVGGLVGLIGYIGYYGNTDTGGDIYNSYALNKSVNGTGEYIGKVIGHNIEGENQGILSNLYYINMEGNGTNNFGELISNEDVTSLSHYKEQGGWGEDISDSTSSNDTIWKIVDGKSYPYLNGLSNPMLIKN